VLTAAGICIPDRGREETSNVNKNTAKIVSISDFVWRLFHIHQKTINFSSLIILIRNYSRAVGAAVFHSLETKRRCGVGRRRGGGISITVTYTNPMVRASGAPNVHVISLEITFFFQTATTTLFFGFWRRASGAAIGPSTRESSELIQI